MPTACLALYQVLHGDTETSRTLPRGTGGTHGPSLLKYKQHRPSSPEKGYDGWKKVCRLLLTFTLARKDSIPTTPDTAPAIWIRCALPGNLHCRFPEENQEGSKKASKRPKVMTEI